ncbi:MAG: glycosyl hydrolase [Firmicutes bacterium]|uniref:BNR-Asp box repeat-containing protein n=1 Tax=Melghirimyces thermohalophilus TaxID=1236220 RepID=A0A1G6I969_9BACL|nr:sialidase family protein [Melghirimyces thermohalophilus]MDA8351780.1 glycosyl hydrolase [Bacillota bacterium]SDC02980.1 BNR-Asp box repeat-containing protein [Melghirimyces thermohalophilus]
MTKMYLAMEQELLVVEREGDRWTTKEKLVGMQPLCVAVDPHRKERVYCGTFGRGLWRSDDAGKTWEPIASPGRYTEPVPDQGGIPHSMVTAVAVSPTEKGAGYGVVYAGTEPTALYRSEDGGESWTELEKVRLLPSAPTWSFPPRPHTSHIRWITPDPAESGKIYVSVEAGALIRSEDGGKTWKDRTFRSPLDTHTLLAHPQAPGRLYAAAGDGLFEAGREYAESWDGGQTWQNKGEGLKHHYLYGMAVDPGNPDVILVSAAKHATYAHHLTQVSPASTLYRKEGDQPWQEVSEGLPSTEGMVIPILSTNETEPGTFYALTNHGLYRSADSGHTWERLNVDWKEEYRQQHQQDLVVTD